MQPVGVTKALLALCGICSSLCQQSLWSVERVATEQCSAGMAHGLLLAAV